MAKSRKNKGNRSFTGQVLARASHEAKVDAMRGNYGAPGARAWKASNARKAASKKACRGKVQWA